VRILFVSLAMLFYPNIGYSAHVSPKKAGKNLSQTEITQLGTDDDDDTGSSADELIKDHFLRVSSRFLDPQKDQYIENQQNAHGVSVQDLFAAFQKKYDKNKTNKNSPLCLDGLSARARIALLRKIVAYKVTQTTDLKTNKKWDFGPRQFKIYDKKSRSYVNSRPYSSYIDKIPTCFAVGPYSYVLEQEITNSNPGGGRLYGLKTQNSNKATAESYQAIDKLLQPYKSHGGSAIVELFSGLLKEQKKNGLPIEFTQEQVRTFPSDRRGKQAVDDLQRLLNGLSLLHDYEVVRRLVKDDGYVQYTADGDEHALPVILGESYLFNATSLMDSYNKIFIGKSTERMNFISNTILAALTAEQKQLQGQVLRKTVLRESLKLFHNDDEDSADEYSSSEE
jgi:hypothetical protein